MKIVNLTLGALSGALLGTAVSATWGQDRPAPTPDHALSTEAPRHAVRVYAEAPPRTLDETTRIATRVVRAEVLQLVEEYLPQVGRVRTAVQLRTLESHLGEMPETFEVSYPAGSAGGVRMIVPNAPDLRVGSEAVLFLAEAHPGHFGLLALDRSVVRRELDGSGRAVARGPLGADLDWTEFQHRLAVSLAQRELEEESR